MNSHITALRAISAEFASSIIRPVIVTVAIIVVVLIALIWLLASQISVWLWLLLIPVGVLCLVIFAISLVIGLIIRAIRPKLTHDQRQAVRAFTDKTASLNETIRTPYPLLLARATIDLLIHRDGRYVRGIINDSQSLKGEYQAIQKYFDIPPADNLPR